MCIVAHFILFLGVAGCNFHKRFLVSGWFFLFVLDIFLQIGIVNACLILLAACNTVRDTLWSFLKVPGILFLIPRIKIVKNRLFIPFRTAGHNGTLFLHYPGMVAAGCYNTRDEYQGAVIIFIRVLHREDVGRNRMMQGITVLVDCFPLIRGSHFVDPVWVVVWLVFGRCILLFCFFHDFRVVGGRYRGSILIFIIIFPTIIQCPFLIHLIEVIGNHRYPDNAWFINGWIIATPTNIRWAGCIATGSVIIRCPISLCCINDCGLGTPKDGWNRNQHHCCQRCPALSHPRSKLFEKPAFVSAVWNTIVLFFHDFPPK